MIHTNIVTSNETSARNKSPRILSRPSSLSCIPPETDMTCYSID